MKIGDIVKFSIDHDNHVAKVQIMNVSNGDRKLFTCRRLDNGISILAFEEDLTPEKEKS